MVVSLSNSDSPFIGRSGPYNAKLSVDKAHKYGKN